MIPASDAARMESKLCRQYSRHGSLSSSSIQRKDSSGKLASVPRVSCHLESESKNISPTKSKSKNSRRAEIRLSLHILQPSTQCAMVWGCFVSLSQSLQRKILVLCVVSLNSPMQKSSHLKLTVQELSEWGTRETTVSLLEPKLHAAPVQENCDPVQKKCMKRRSNSPYWIWSWILLI